VKLAGRMGRLGTESACDVLAGAEALEGSGRKVIHFEIREPDFDTPQHEAAMEALRSGQTNESSTSSVPVAGRKPTTGLGP